MVSTYRSSHIHRARDVGFGAFLSLPLDPGHSHQVWLYWYRDAMYSWHLGSTAAQLAVINRGFILLALLWFEILRIYGRFVVIFLVYSALIAWESSFKVERRTLCDTVCIEW